MTDHRERVVKATPTTSTAHRLTEYDGDCANIHGHNMEWTIELGVTMEHTDDDNMPVDFKDIDDFIDDHFDHACILSANDPIFQVLDRQQVQEFFGDVMTWEGDPTCEAMSEWVARNLVNKFDAVEWAVVEVAETDKYSIRTVER